MTDLTGTSLTRLADVDLVVAVGSVDGICTAAALLRIIGRDDVGLQFTQAFTVDKLPVREWSGRKVALVDLAVNNRNPQMTADFIAALRAGGNQLVAVIDEHSREDWLAVLGSFDGLVIEPQSQNDGDDAPKSSGEVLRRALADAGVEVSIHTHELLDAADAADRMDFTTHFGALVNQAVKSRIQDDTRRVYLARHFAWNWDADEKILNWIAEYEAILRNHTVIMTARQFLGNGIVRVVATGKAVDMTTLMSELYLDGARVVALEGEAFVPAKQAKEILVAFGTADKRLDLMMIVRASGVTPLGGFAQKVNVDLADEQRAIAAIRAALQG